MYLCLLDFVHSVVVLNDIFCNIYIDNATVINRINSTSIRSEKSENIGFKNEIIYDKASSDRINTIATRTKNEPNGSGIVEVNQTTKVRTATTSSVTSKRKLNEVRKINPNGEGVERQDK